jgi:hypothetical protein
MHILLCGGGEGGGSRLGYPQEFSEEKDEDELVLASSPSAGVGVLNISLH